MIFHHGVKRISWIFLSGKLRFIPYWGVVGVMFYPYNQMSFQFAAWTTKKSLFFWIHPWDILFRAI